MRTRPMTTARGLIASVGQGAKRAPARILAWRGEALAAASRPPIILLGTLFLIGALLRAWLFVQWRPAFLGYSDSSIYIWQAGRSIYIDPIHLGGYGLFLQIMHGIRPRLSFAIFVQHVLGLASGLLLFGAMRRAGVRDWIAVLPAAVVFLSGSEIFLEHAALSEALFIFLVNAGLYAVVRAWQANWSWVLVAGLMFGMAATVRSLGLPLAVIVALVGVLGSASAWRARLVQCALLIFAAAVPLGIYSAEQKRVTGFGGLPPPLSYFDLYGRVAEFADCSKFNPPADTRFLCITAIPVSQRQGPYFWEFTGSSPAVKAFGDPDLTQPKPGETAKLRSFALAAILGQPSDYLEYVGRDLVRIVDPSFASSPYAAIGNTRYGSGPQGLISSYLNPFWIANAARLMHGYYPDGLIQRDVTQLVRYEKDTRLEGPAMALLLLLALIAPFLGRGPDRRAAILFGSAALVLLATPSFVDLYEYRFVIPAFGPLAATAAIGAAALLPHVQALSRPIVVRISRNVRRSRT